MSLKAVNFSALEWQDFPSIESARFGARWAPIADRVGARKLGYGSWIVPPGRASVPYHYHLVNEELAIVLGGEVWIRLDGRFHPLADGDVVAMPPGADGVHQFLNFADRPAHLLLASTKIPREVVGYPDSGKRAYAVAGLAGDPPMERVMTKDGRILEGVAGYFESEPVGEPIGDPPAPAGERDPRIVRPDDIPWEPYRVGPFGAERKRIARVAGARLLGYSLYRIAPGGRPWAFHFHHVNEEFFYVRRGYGQLRDRDGTRDLAPGDAFACPPGPDGAHAILNTGDAPLEVFALSTMEHPEVIEYPDSDKLYVMVGSPPGGDPAERAIDAAFRRVDAVSYEEGER
ncbi:MAG TPA: cupin domain-containing protein [Gemmatimonadota bacterium]|nr:cupin domain-containing protein [Gemmatimonadota bacterium]